MLSRFLCDRAFGNPDKKRARFIVDKPFDGVRRQVRIMTPVRFSVELMQDGFRKDYPITLRGTEELSFCIETVLINLITQLSGLRECLKVNILS